jgi:hypothetical protein
MEEGRSGLAFYPTRSMMMNGLFDFRLSLCGSQ